MFINERDVKGIGEYLGTKSLEETKSSEETRVSRGIEKCNRFFAGRKALKMNVSNLKFELSWDRECQVPTGDLAFENSMKGFKPGEYRLSVDDQPIDVENASNSIMYFIGALRLNNTVVFDSSKARDWSKWEH